MAGWRFRSTSWCRRYYKTGGGAVIPADLHLAGAGICSSLRRGLTGESLPVEKAATTRQPEHSNPLECDALCFMGTTVVSGTAQAMVIATGADTLFGQTGGVFVEQEKRAECLSAGDRPRQYAADSLYAGDGFGGVVINGYTKGDWWEAALFGFRSR